MKVLNILLEAVEGWKGTLINVANCTTFLFVLGPE